MIAPRSAEADRAPIGEPIFAGACYTKRQLMRAVGIGKDAFHSLVAKGLKVRLIGKQAQVLGEDYIEFLKAQPTSSAVDLADN